MADPDEGVLVDFRRGDQTVVQLDEGSLHPERSTAITPMSFYKMLTTAEKEKNMTEFKVSHLAVTRKADGDVSAGTDELAIQVTNPVKFKSVADPRGTGPGFWEPQKQL